MLKILVKKQLTEVFRGYFFDAKKNRMRSKGAIVCWFLFFIAIMAGLLGGLFTYLANTLCTPLASVGLGWFYFLLMTGIAVILGAFGSVFNSYSGLYLSKDNDLLLALPIPVRTIIAARLINVYLMGVLYTATALIPTLIVYWVTTGLTVPKLICGILLFIIVTAFVMILSCLLGWVVAKISLRLKNRSFITVLLALLFIGLYYFLYFRASALIREIISNAEFYGEKISATAYFLLYFGRIGEGDLLSALVFLAMMAVVLILIWTVLSRSFLKIATSSGNAQKIRYVEKAAKERTVFGALFTKEMTRFTSSPNYMLNCGLAILVLPAAGVLMLIKGQDIMKALGGVFSSMPNASAVLFAAALCLAAAVNDIAAPSVSLEGKSLWIPKSLPVLPRTVLRAKMSVHLILTAGPMLFAAACTAHAAGGPTEVRILAFLTPLCFTAFSAAAGTVIGVRMPLLNWTNETAPIKQSGAVLTALLGGWGIIAAFAGIYLLGGHRIGTALYLLIWTILFAVGTVILIRWLDTKGAAAFAEL